MTKNASYEPSSRTKSCRNIRGWQNSVNASFLLYKRKDRGLNGFIVIQFTDVIAKWAWGRTLREVSLKQAREFAKQWHSVFT
ncbi:hypothetical protein [Bartonella sp. OT172YNZD]|uniref:hypothetical protein n=1 Tax=Bartonella sp. OT172YNZD TaxID=3243572 RepID=UPI0035CFB6F6